MKGEELSDQFLDFAARVVKLTAALPKNLAGRHIAGQLLRSGTAIGSNYEEARGAESRADFIHRLSISWKEARESWYWLRLVARAQLIKPGRIEKLLQEGNEIAAFLPSRWRQREANARSLMLMPIPRRNQLLNS